MARQQSVSLIDDLDGSKAVETIRFGLEGTNYEIDLNRKHAANLRKSLGDFVEHGRKAKPANQPRRNAKSTNATSGPPAVDVRAWAVANGIAVSARGRIPADIVKQYQRSVR